jgi:hypothetical protein
MNKVIVFLLSCILTHVICPRIGHATIKKISYRGWDECYQITNGKVKVIVNTSAMGSILVYEKNNMNMMWEDSTINGKTLKDYREKDFPVDAGRFDYGPLDVAMDIHEITWVGPYTAEILGEHSLKITSMDDTNMGIRTSRVFELDPESSHLKITLTMTNISDSITRYWFWGRTLVPVGGKLFSPVHPESKWPDKWVRYIWTKPTTFSSDPEDNGVTIEDSLFVLIPEKAENNKYATDAESGWMAYGYKGLIFLKTYKHFPGARYTTEGQMKNIFYISKDLFVEMEPVSPEAVLQPGESYSFVENWYLLDFPPARDVNFNTGKAVKTIFKEVIEK